jgi:hypothetical protein
MEVHVFRRAAGDGFVSLAIRPCYPNGEKPKAPPEAGTRAFVVRRGTLFRLNSHYKIGKNDLSPGIYRVVALPGEADARVSFFPHFQNANPKDGQRLAPIRADIAKLAGHITLLSKSGRELPHPSSAQS